MTSNKISALSPALTERVILMMCAYGNREQSFRDVRDLFNIKFRANRQRISAVTFRKRVSVFTATNEDSWMIEILQLFIEDPHISTRKTVYAHDTSKIYICHVLKNVKFYPFKINFVQKLVTDDFNRRIEFCDIMMQKIDDYLEFINKIVFSDKATFVLDGTVNSITIDIGVILICII